MILLVIDYEIVKWKMKSRVGFHGLVCRIEYLSRIMENRAFFEGNQKKICPARNELAFTVLRLYGFPSTDFSGFCASV